MAERYTTTFQVKRVQKRLHELEAKLDNASKAVGRASEFGDLWENAEFDAARADESSLDTRIADLSRELTGCEVVDPKTIRPTAVRISTKVSVEDLTSHETKVFAVVGLGEVYSDRGEVSYSSPVGAALIAGVPGEIREINTPEGVRRYKILKIESYIPED